MIVESNWVLDVALQRHTGSSAIWELAKTDQFTVYIPAICLTEPVKAVESLQRRWRQRIQELGQEINELGRAKAISYEADDFRRVQDALSEASDQVTSVFWNTLADIVQYTRALEVNQRIVVRTAEIERQLNLSPADALVLATVVDAKSRSDCRVFVSRDAKAFDSADVRAFLQEADVAYYSDPRQFLRSMGLRLL